MKHPVQINAFLDAKSKLSAIDCTQSGLHNGQVAISNTPTYTI